MILVLLENEHHQMKRVEKNETNAMTFIFPKKLKQRNENDAKEMKVMQ